MRIHPLVLAGLSALLFAQLSLPAAAMTPPLPTKDPTTGFTVFLPLVVRPGTGVQPNPLNMPVRLDVARASSRLVKSGATGLVSSVTLPAAGGTITAIAADGARFTLEIPPDALITDTTILMTPVAAVNNYPLGGAAGAAVQLEPDGLQFLRPVTLTISTTVAIPVAQELMLFWHGDGQEFHRYPPSLEHPYPQVVFSLMHFTGGGVFSEVDPLPVSDSQPIPTDPEDQFKQSWDDLIRREREAQANGLPGDPSLHQELIDLLRYYYDQVIRPMMQRAEGDCDYAEAGAVGKAMGWGHEADILRRSDELVAERDELQTSFTIVLENCWQKRTQPCLNRNDATQMLEALRVARIGQTLGLNFNINDVPDCQCSGLDSIRGWTLTYSASFSRSTQGTLIAPDYVDVSVDRRESGTLVLDNAKGSPGYPEWDSVPGGVPNHPTGAASIDDLSVDHANDGTGRTWTSSTKGSGTVGGFADLAVDGDTCTYDLEFRVGTHVTDVNRYGTAAERDMLVLDVLALGRSAYYTASEGAPTLSGHGRFYADARLPLEEGMEFGDGSASHYLLNLFPTSVGYGPVDWTLTPLAQTSGSSWSHS